MKPIRVVGSCLLVAVALSAIFAAGASAEAPEWGQCLKKAEAGGVGYADSKCEKAAEGTPKAKFEWIPGAEAGKNTFTMSGGSMTWNTTDGKTLTCTSQNAVGEYSLTNSKEMNFTLFELTGCELSNFKCTTGSAEGVLVFNELAGEVGFENVTNKTTALKLYPVASADGKFVTFKCADLEFAWRGKGGDPTAGILVNIKNDNMTATETLKYTASKGVQKPVKWEGVPTETYMESSFEKQTFERIGWTETTIIKNDEKMEYELNRNV